MDEISVDISIVFVEDINCIGQIAWSESLFTYILNN